MREGVMGVDDQLKLGRAHRREPPSLYADVDHLELRALAPQAVHVPVQEPAPVGLRAAAYVLVLPLSLSRWVGVGEVTEAHLTARERERVLAPHLLKTQV